MIRDSGMRASFAWADVGGMDPVSLRDSAEDKRREAEHERWYLAQRAIQAAYSQVEKAGKQRRIAKLELEAEALDEMADETEDDPETQGAVEVRNASSFYKFCQGITRAEYDQLEAQQQSRAVALGHTAEGIRMYWFRDTIWTTREAHLETEDVEALVLETDNRKRLRLQRAHALSARTDQLDTKAKRQPIPQDVKVLVWQRDGGRCVECGSNANLEYDHIIPLSMGGSNTDRNLQLLCEVCNRRKGATLG